METSLFQYALHLADNTLILGQRNAEWTGHGPVLEQDIAITNISLDLIGQSRNFYQYAATLYNNFNKKEKEEVLYLMPHIWKTFDRELTEDDLAFLRDERQYLNLLMVELPKGDWGFSILRQFFFSLFQWCQFEVLKKSNDAQLAAIAEKSSKEITYHLRWSSEWVIRLGDGTEESKARMIHAVENLWPFTGEFFAAAPFETDAVTKGFGVEVADLKDQWLQKVAAVFNEAGLEIPSSNWAQSGGKDGIHSENLGPLLAEMQYLQRAYPNASW